MLRFDTMPLALRERPQWVCWKYEQREEGKKPTKIPYSPRTATKAAVDDPHTWASFDEGVATFQASDFDGIGFVLTADDPFVFIDFDKPLDEAQMERHNRLYDALETYTELSPSGTGYHKIAFGRLPPTGRKREQIELYDRARYMTMTGNVVGDCCEIRDCNEFVNALWRDMGAAVASTNGFDAPASEDDAAIVARTFSASYGAKARDLYEGRWQQHFPNRDGPSEADLALVNYIALNTNSREKTRRLFFGSALGQRDKYAERPNLVDDMIAKAFAIKGDPDAFASLIADIRAVVDRSNEEARANRIVVSLDTLPIVEAAELAGRRIVPPRWIVDGLIPDRTVTLFSSDGGVGKSLAAMQLAFAVAAGSKWFGSYTREGGCLYLSAEDEIDEVHRRLAIIARFEGLALDSLPHRLSIAPLAGHDALLALPAARGGALAPTPLFGALRDRIADQRPAVVILDTSADLFGGEENNRTQVRQFVAMLRATAMEFDTAIVLLSHPSLSGLANDTGLSGSTAWNNSVRSRLYMTRDKDNSNMRVIRVMKANYGPTGGEIRLEFRNGVLFAIGRSDDSNAHRLSVEASVDEVFIALVREFNARKHRLSPSHNSPMNYAPKLFAKHSASQGYNARQFNDAMVRLLANKAIEIGRFGDYASKQKDNIVIATTSDAPSGSISE